MQFSGGTATDAGISPVLPPRPASSKTDRTFLNLKYISHTKGARFGFGLSRRSFLGVCIRRLADRMPVFCQNELHLNHRNALYAEKVL
jgi:hypothetical protein